MLSELYIENVAVIEKLSIDFEKGFNVFTGETGAGKSIIIDAINAITGQRISKNLIRTGKEKAVVCATFTNISKENLETLEKAGFETDEYGSLVLQRTVFTNGRNICKINGIPANVSTLREITEGLITIHGQYETYELFNDDAYINYLDKYSNDDTILAEYKNAYHNYKDIEKIYKKAKNNRENNARQIDILRYQINELEKAELADGEIDDLEYRKGILLNAEKINSNIFNALELLKGNDEIEGALSGVLQSLELLNEISGLDENYQRIADRLQNIYYDLEDCISEVFAVQDNVEFNQNELNEIEERLELISSLSKKYGNDISEMLIFLANSKKQLEELENLEYNQESIENDYRAAVKLLKESGEKLTFHRKNIAVEFIKAVKDQLVFLDMPNLTLDFNISQTAYTEKGKDKIEILISTNPGEVPKPISKIASGGELSRIMLGIKNVLADKDIIETLIFDEVDTGISGSTTQRVGIKLKQISKSRQILCITHQAQMASMANSHYLIKKSVINDRSYTTVKKLEFEERKRELARIMGGIEITEATLKLAEEMINKESQI